MPVNNGILKSMTSEKGQDLGMFEEIISIETSRGNEYFKGQY